MKIRLTILLISATMLAHAQQDYVITLKNDTIWGKVSLLQNKYYDEVTVKNSDDKKSFKAYQLFLVYYDGEAYDPIAYRNRKVFGKRIAKGKLSYYLIRNDNELDFTEGILTKNGETLNTGIGFRGRATDFFADCKDLVEKIEAKELGSSDIDEIVKFYNTQCGPSYSKEQVGDFHELNDIAQLILDVLARVKSGQEVPGYMVKALKDVSDYPLSGEINRLLLSIDN